MADHLGAAYLRYSFTKGTEQEVSFLVDALGLAPGQRVLDVGCGPGRHSYALARRGMDVLGIDVARRFVDLAQQSAPPGASFVVGDA
ncbi:MAG: class I SAM-dependent methyltransferase, partial [Acidimicrobiia bacterium]